MRLSTALDEYAARGHVLRTPTVYVLEHVPTGVAEVDDTIEAYGPYLARWWWRSPMGVIECGECGEVAYVGDGSRTRTCWACSSGEMTQLKLAHVFADKRPRRRRVKIAAP